MKMDLRDAVLSGLPNPSLRACRANLIIVLTRSYCSDGELSLSVGEYPCPAMSGVLLNDGDIHKEVAFTPPSGQRFRVPQPTGTNHHKHPVTARGRVHEIKKKKKS